MGNLTTAPHVSVHLEAPETDPRLAVLASAGSVNRISCYNGGASTVYLQLFDSTTPPVDTTTVPTFAPIPIAAGGYYESDAILPFADGCYAAISTGPAVYGADDQTGVFLDVAGIYA